MSEAVRSMFAAISRRYDLANRAITLGLDQSWRRKLVALGADTRVGAPIRPGARVLDCACGTGDVALELLERVGPRGRVIGVDFTSEMIELARAKARRIESDWLELPSEAETLRQRLSFEVADVLQMPFETATFDAATIAYGVRNLDDPLKGLMEMARVVRPGGAVLVLETGVPANRLLRSLHRLYSTTILRLLGGLITGNPAAYGYLQRTASSFPSGEQFTGLMQETGCFSDIKMWPLAGGVSWLYRGIVH